MGLTADDLPLPDSIRNIEKPGWALGSAGKKVWMGRMAALIAPRGKCMPQDPAKYFGLKHYEWKQLMFSGIAEYCLDGLLGAGGVCLGCGSFELPCWLVQARKRHASQCSLL